MLALAALAMAPDRAVRPCDGDTTVAVEACLGAELTAAQAELDRYLAATRTHLASWQDGQPAKPARLVAEFDAAERTWEAYRRQECDTLADVWAGGTIRGAKGLSCRTRLTRQRTHNLWRTFLTYPDSTPSILPEPATGD